MGTVAKVEMGTDEHSTYVERVGESNYYWWCSNIDCTADNQHFVHEGEAQDSAREHSEHPFDFCPKCSHEYPAGQHHVCLCPECGSRRHDGGCR